MASPCTEAALHNINLLSWREAAIRAKQKAQLILIGLSVSIPIMIFAADESLSIRLGKLEKENERLTQSASRVMNADGASNLLNRLIQYREQMQGILYSIRGNRINKVCLDNLYYRNSRYGFTGKTPSIWYLLKFLKEWPANKYFAEINIQKLNQSSNGLFKFHLLAPKGTSMNLLPESINA